MPKFVIPEPNKPQKRCGPIKEGKYEHIIEGHSGVRMRQRKIKEIWIKAAIENGRMVNCNPQGKKKVQLQRKEIKAIIKSLRLEIERLKSINADEQDIEIVQKKISDFDELYELKGIIVVYHMVTRKVITVYTQEDPTKDKGK